MKTISDKKFIKKQYDRDSIVALRIKNDNLYFLAWMENAEHYKIQKAIDTDEYLLDKHTMLITKNVFYTILNNTQYNCMYLLYETDDNHKLINDHEKSFKNEYEQFLTLVENGASSDITNKPEHNILMLTQKEFCSICNILKDGDYVFIFKD